MTGMISADPKFEFIGACLSVFCLCLFAVRGAGSWLEVREPEVGLSYRDDVRLVKTVVTTVVVERQQFSYQMCNSSALSESKVVV